MGNLNKGRSQGRSVCDRTQGLPRREAIARHCKDCGDNVKDCQISTCHLYPFKLPRSKQDPKERAEAIHKYCLWCMGDTTHSPDHVIDCQDVECTLHPYRLKGNHWSEDRSVVSSKHAPLVKSKAKNAHIEANFEKGIPEYGLTNSHLYMSKNGLKFDQGQVDLKLLGFICLFEVMIGFIITFPLFK